MARKPVVKKVKAVGKSKASSKPSVTVKSNPEDMRINIDVSQMTANFQRFAASNPAGLIVGIMAVVMAVLLVFG